MMTIEQAMEKASAELAAQVTALLDASFARMMACGIDGESAGASMVRARWQADAWERATLQTVRERLEADSSTKVGTHGE